MHPTMGLCPLGAPQVDCCTGVQLFRPARTRVGTPTNGTSVVVAAHGRRGGERSSRTKRDETLADHFGLVPEELQHDSSSHGDWLLAAGGRGLRFLLPLVWFVFGFSVLGYLSQLVYAVVYRPEVRTSVYARLYFLTRLIVMAGIMHLMLWRVRVIVVHHSNSARVASDR